MERASGKDLRVFFDQWLTRGGLVRLDGDWTYSAGAKSIAIRLTQRDRARLFTMPLQVGVYTAGGTTPVITTVQLSDASHEFQIAVGQRPDRVVLDPNRVVLMESEFAEAKR
jgi:aminopeptidase N